MSSHTWGKDTSPSFRFTNMVNQSLVANFGPRLMQPPSPPHALLISWLTNFNGYQLQQISNLRSSNWVNATDPVTIVGTNYQAHVTTTNGPRFFRIQHP